MGCSQFSDIQDTIDPGVRPKALAMVQDTASNVDCDEVVGSGTSISATTANTANQIITTTTAISLHFDTLPPEIRLKIYEAIYATNPPINLIHPAYQPIYPDDHLDDGTPVIYKEKSSPELKYLTTLLGTSKQVREEVLPVFWKNVVVDVGGWNKDWVGSETSEMAGPWALSKLEKVRIMLMMGGNPSMRDFMRVFQSCKLVEMQWAYGALEVNIPAAQTSRFDRELAELLSADSYVTLGTDTGNDNGLEVLPPRARRVVKARHVLESKVFRKAVWESLTITRGPVSGFGGEIAIVGNQMQDMRDAGEEVRVQVLVSTSAQLKWANNPGLCIIMGHHVEVRRYGAAASLKVTIDLGAKVMKIELGSASVVAGFAELALL